MADYYAWAPIVHKDKDNKLVTFNPGNKITSDFLDSMDDDELVETWKRDGVIRTAKFPKDVPLGMSVRNHLLRKANDEYERATQIGSPQPEQEQQEQPAPAQSGQQAPPTQGN